MDYIKYGLKSQEELKELIKDKDNFYLIACNKCFKVFDQTEEPDAGVFAELAEAQGKRILGLSKVDFLCNKVQSQKKLMDLIPEEAEYVAVVSCGLGVQTVADMAEVPTLTACDSLNYIGSHGMALTPKACDACAQCYLNLTGGICPVVDCSKSLLNGQCGGAKNGKCEVDCEKDCAWEKIYQRLDAQGRTEEFAKRPVQLRDYAKVNHKVISDYVKDIRQKRLEGFYGGVHPVENKEYTEGAGIQKFPEPAEVVIPLSMHVGAPASPLVAVGDYVKLGQKIGEASSFISCNVHSSVSGTVVSVDSAVTIQSDGKNVLDVSVQPSSKTLDELTATEIIDLVKEKGINGMGGAGFPTHIKLMPGKPIDTVLINGSECEPYLTADHRVLLEYADEVLLGLQAIMKAVGAPRGVILIEDNKQDAIDLLTEKTAAMDRITIMAAQTQYPEGAEKMLIKRVLGRTVPSGKLPADVGCVVSNVSTAKAISDAITKGMPLVERVVTVTGEYIPHPGNFLVKIGTDVQSLIDYCGGLNKTDVTLKMGGPMMGTLLQDPHVPVKKTTNGIIAIETDHRRPTECIKCGRCVDVCPMELKPLLFHKYLQEENPQALLDNNIKDCFSCHCCEYICSSKIPLVSEILQGKAQTVEFLKTKH